MSSDADTLRRRKAAPPPPPPGSPPPTTPAPAAAPRRAATCCGRCRWLCVVLLLALSVVGLWLKLVCTVMESRHRAWPVCRPTAMVNNAMMRFFRDVSRAKARRRLHRNDGALVTLMMGNEEPLSIGDNDPSDASTMTPEELGEMNGLHGTPLYLSIRGRIYDVTKGGSFYGIGKSYHKFIGRDASRAFATGCHADACLSSSLENLSDAELKELDNWVELYEYHDKYVSKRCVDVLAFIFHPMTHPLDYGTLVAANAPMYRYKHHKYT